MELRVLRYFLAVAREENISRAADVLYVTQPTLSRQLMELEDELGTKLFIRGKRKITLTDEGLLLRRRAEEILDLVRKTQTEFDSQEEIVSGNIFIGGGETESMSIIARIAREMQRDYPYVRFNIYSGDSKDVTERLDKGLLDFGLLIELNPLKYESLRLPAVDTWGLLMRKDSPLAARKTIKPKDLWNIPLITSRQSLAAEKILKWLNKDFDELNLVATYNLVYNASLMVREGMGYALCLDRLVNTSGPGTLCFRPLWPVLESNLHMVWKKDQVFSKASGLFLKKLRQALVQE
ncbi:LysR family transcriptional regulator [Brucepastera parasyntrophica]|uniref:LysR family transcriptional regulator n=1 Tax=Brucepastera parasyntrophica TaxID=2880008 RepID=UPI0021088AE6|nr:LysR family transcriptional regulator [Brucepastera parasyntrophica]ULQ60427.1 LysR family transcriptional regulator [Brucepastera parasyntrophica]